MKTKLTELEKVEAWLVQKRSENEDLRAMFKVNNNLKWLVNIQQNSELICMGEKWLAHQRVKIPTTETKG